MDDLVKHVLEHPDEDCGTLLGQWCAFNHFRKNMSTDLVFRAQQEQVITATCGMCLCSQSFLNSYKNQ